MHDFDTRAVFVGGPVNGRMEMLTGKPATWQFDHFLGTVWQGHALSRVTYRRDETTFIEGDMIAYVYAGEEVLYD